MKKFITSSAILKDPKFRNITTANVKPTAKQISKAVERTNALLGFDAQTPMSHKISLVNDLAAHCQFFVAVTSDLLDFAIWANGENFSEYALTKALGSDDWSKRAIYMTGMTALAP